MRIIYHLFFTIIIIVSFEIQKSARGNEKDGNEAIIDTKFVELEDDETDDSEVAEKPVNKKERTKGMANFVGTNLFGDANGSRKNCFSSEDIALLAARRDFESLIPKDLPNCLLDDELAKLLMQYFYGASQVVDKMTRGHSKTLAQRAFYDTLGGYLRYYMIPISKYSFYGGLVKLRTVQSILELYSESKQFLNTNGNGWREPLTDFSDLDIKIDPLRIIMNNEDEDTSCTQLDLLDERTGEDDDMIVALPRLDPEENGLLRNIWFPFKRKRTFDLQSSMSAFVLLRYFELTTRCYKFQRISQDFFNKRLKDWLLENVEIHLKDDVLYPGLGAMLRIIETLRRKRNESFVIVAKTNEKRQRTDRLNQIKNRKPKPIVNSDNSMKSIFESQVPTATNNRLFDETLTEKEENCRRRKYIYIAIAVSVCLVLIVFFVIGLTLCKNRPWHKSTPDKPASKPQKTGWFCCRKQPKDDEEVLVYSKKPSSDKSKSKKFSKKNGRSSNNSQPESTACCGLCSNKNGPAVIETSSMDSDSGKDSKNKQKSSPSKSKTIMVDEKKRFSISKKNKHNDAEGKLPPAKVGILKKGI